MVLKVYQRGHHKKRRTLPLPNWSELQTELLELIIKKLSLPDMLRVKAVCSSWNYAAKSFPALFPPQSSPWLILLSKQENGPEDTRSISTRCFYSLEEKKVYTIKNFSLGDYNDQNDAWCVGSSHGWLVIMNQNAVAPFLLNPISGHIIKLPLLTWAPPSSIHPAIAKAVISSDPSCDENFSIVVIYGSSVSSILIYCKPGEQDSKWTGLGCHYREYSDVIFKNDQLFALIGDGSIEVWDFNNSFRVKTITLHPPAVKFEKLNMIKEFPRDKFSTKTYLVESLGEILLVGRVIGNFVNHEGKVVYEGDWEDGTICPYRTKHFYILKLDFIAEKWEEVDSLNGRALFLGGNESMSLSTNDFPECQENSIYFTDDNWEEIHCLEFCSGTDGDYGGHDIGIYNIGSKVVKPLNQFDQWRIDPPPFWIVPNPF